MELLRLHINVKKTIELKSSDNTVRMVLFDGFCNSDIFKGKILEGAVDTQIIGAEELLSARYMLEGVDREGDSYRLYIENNTVHNGEGTKPVVYTDSSSLKWLETAKLKGEIIHNDDLEIVICSEDV